MDDLARPPRFADEELDALREALVERARGASLETREFPTLGERLVEEAPDRPLVSPEEFDTRVFDEEPSQDAGAGAPARVNPRLFARVPAATLDSEGTVTVRFTATGPIAGGSIYYGTQLDDDPFGLARLRRRAGGLQRSGDVHSLAFDLGRILGRRHDITRVRARGRGLLRYRLEALDAAAGTARVHDGRMAFRCAPVPCTDDATFIQLPTVRLGPFVDLVGPTSATVSVDTDVDTVALLALRSENGEIHRFFDDAPGTRHEIVARELSADSRYRYVVLVVDGRGEVSEARSATFGTWPAPSEDTRLTFAVLSDSRSGHGAADEQYAGTNREVLDDLLRRALEEGARFVVFVGDLIDGYRTHPGSFQYELEAWQKASESVHASIPIYEVMGNHEALVDYWTPGWAVAQNRETSAEAVFAARFVNPANAPSPEDGAPPYLENVYAFDAGPARLVVLNTNYFFRSHFHREDHPAHGRGEREGWLDDRQLAWLTEQLGPDSPRHRYVFTHEPGFPNGGHVQDAMWWRGAFPEVLERRDELFAAMSRGGVDAVFHGDEHNYSRTRVDSDLVAGVERPLWQLISGGAGAPYYARDEEVPWADHVEAFDGRQHLIMVTIEGDSAHARAVSRTGETLDRFELRSAR